MKDAAKELLWFAIVILGIIALVIWILAAT
jgi:hypothetical protein